MEITVRTNGFGKMFGVPNLVVDQYLRLATPSQLKVLLYLLRHNDLSLGTSEIAKAAGISEELAEEALLFWSQTDLFTVQELPIDKTVPQLEASAEQPNPETPLPNHTTPPPLSSNSRKGELTPIEIAAAIEGSEDLKTLFVMTEQQLGRPLRHMEQKALVWMHDYDNIGSDVILTVLMYCKSIDAGFSYAETLITSWWNDGIQTLAQVNTAIRELEHRRSFQGHIQKAFEMNRKPTPKQQELIQQWQDQEIPLELITYAYEKTIEGTDKLSFPYLNSILMRWWEAGYRTRVDVDTKDHPIPQEKKGRRQTKEKKQIPVSDNAKAYQSFIYNLDE